MRTPLAVIMADAISNDGHDDEGMRRRRVTPASLYPLTPAAAGDTRTSPSPVGESA